MSGRLGAGDDDVRSGRLDPLAAIIEAGESTDGAEKRERRRNIDVIDVFKDFFDDHAQVLATVNVETGGARMAVNYGLTAERVFRFEPGRARPIDEVGFDGFAVRMAADLAFASMAIEIGRGSRDAARSRRARAFARRSGVGGGGALPVGMKRPDRRRRRSSENIGAVAKGDGLSEKLFVGYFSG